MECALMSCCELLTFYCKVHFWQNATDTASNFESVLSAIEESNADIICLQEVLVNGKTSRDFRLAF